MNAGRAFFLALALAGGSIQAQWYAWSVFARGGLHPKAEINAMSQEASGLLFLATDLGIWAHDGERSWPIPLADTVAVRGTAILAHNERLYLGTRSGTLYQGPLEGPLVRLELEEGHPEAAISALCLDGEGRLWMGTAGEGIYTLEADRWYQTGVADGLPSDWINGLVAEGAWVYAATDGGLARLAFGEPQRRIETPQGGSDRMPILSLTPRHAGGVWAGRFDGSVASWSAEDPGWTLFRTVPGETPSAVLAIAEAGGQLWSGQENGRIHGMALHADSGLPADSLLRPVWFSDQYEPARRVDALMALQEGPMLAVCDRTRLQRWDPYVTEALPGSAAQVQALCERRDGSLLYATLDAVYRIAPGAKTAQRWRATGLPEDAVVVRFFEAADGSLWLGTFEYGAFRLPESGPLEGFAEGPSNVLDFAEGERCIWLAAFDGLWCWNKGTGRMQAMPSGIGSNYIYSLWVDHQGWIWAGTDGDGVHAYSLEANGQLQQRHHGLKGETVYSVVQDANGRVWTRTRKQGLNLLDAGGSDWVQVPMVPPLEHELQALTLDPDGHLLAVHDGGLQRVGQLSDAPRSLAIGQAYEAPKPLSQSVYRTGRHVWLGTDRGPLRINGTLDDLPQAPRIYLRHALASGWPMAEGATVRADRRYIEFLFAGPWHAPGPGTVYEYRLSGLEPDWRSTRDNRISFVRLPPGKYAFAVRARLGENGAPGPARTFHFSVRAPVWQRPWFLLAGTALLFGMLYAYLTVRERRRTRLQEQETERIQSRYEALRNQVNPHFLFNSFNTLSGLIEENPPQAVGFVDRMARFYRQILAHRQHAFIPLKEELTILNDYLGMLRARYEDALEVDIDIPEAYMQHGLPPLSLQLLVENAIKHSRLTKRSPLPIRIRLLPEYRDARPYLEVANPLRPRSTAAPSTGLGLETLLRKFELLGLPEPAIAPDNAAADQAYWFRVALPLAEPGRVDPGKGPRHKTLSA